MASERRHAVSFALRLSARGALAGGLIVAATLLLWSGKPVSAVLALALAVAVGFDLMRLARHAEHAMADVLEQLTIGADDEPPRLDPAFRALDEGIMRAMAAMRAKRIGHAEQIEALQALFDTVPAALFVTDEAGSIVLANRPARALTPAEETYLARHSAFAPGDAAALVAASAGTKRLLRLADGRSALAGTALFTHADGTCRRLVSVQIVAEELGAVEANAWHHLSRVLAHEMMNSLSPVVSLAESMASLLTQQESALDRAEIAASLELMGRRASHLMGFVERYRAMLDIPEAVPEPVDMAEFASDLVRIAQAKAPQIAVDAQVEPPDLTVAMDRQLIEQALINLLKNAVEAIAEVADPVVTLIVRQADGATLIDVVDNGPGLPTDPDTLFLPFYTTKPEGSGVGLAVARQIAHAHGGTLAAMSHARGARFTLKLPNGPMSAQLFTRSMPGL
ncbi:MAG TPA: ATP-binding protein [Sphingobium sp.]|nr:ATP-binding protein [Sphingobium sp.]